MAFSGQKTPRTMEACLGVFCLRLSRTTVRIRKELGAALPVTKLASILEPLFASTSKEIRRRDICFAEAHRGAARSPANRFGIMKSFLLPLMNGLTYCGAISFTSQWAPPHDSITTVQGDSWANVQSNCPRLVFLRST